MSGPSIESIEATNETVTITTREWDGIDRPNYERVELHTNQIDGIIEQLQAAKAVALENKRTNVQVRRNKLEAERASIEERMREIDRELTDA